MRDFEEILDQLGEMPCLLILPINCRIKSATRPSMQKTKEALRLLLRDFTFTKELLQQIQDMGVNIAHVTLHVGLGTFRPVKVDDVEKHHMHSEFYVVEEEQAKLINDTKKMGDE